jgi:hypothetical protein
MYRRPKFLEVLLEIRREMAREADHDVELLVEIARTGVRPVKAERQQPNALAPAAETSKPKRPRRRLVKA